MPQKRKFCTLLLVLALGPFQGCVVLVSGVVSVLVQAPGGELVQPQDALVGVLDEDELAVLALQAHIGDRAHDAPAVGQLEVHLVGEIAGLPADNTKDDVLIVGLGVDAGHETGEKMSAKKDSRGAGKG